MTFAASLQALGWTQSAFARFMDRNPRSVRRWCSEGFPAPLEAEAVLVLMRRFDVTPDDLNALMQESQSPQPRKGVR